MECNVRQPYVVLPVHEQPVRHGKPVRSPLRLLRASPPVEFDYGRAGDRREVDLIRSRPRPPRSMENEYVVFRIHSNTRNDIQRNAVRQDRPTVDDVVISFGSSAIFPKVDRIMSGETNSRWDKNEK